MPTSHDEISQMRVTRRANCLLSLGPLYSCFRAIVMHKKKIKKAQQYRRYFQVEMVKVLVQ